MKIKDILNIGKVCYEVKEWSPLKCIFLSYFTGIYLRIIQERLRKQYGRLKVFYIDLFAGPGINKLNGMRLFGSPIIAIDSATFSNAEPFDMMFFVDSKKENVDALEERLEYLSRKNSHSWIKDRYEVICGDANEKIRKIAKEISREDYYHFLAFIDPYGMDPKWLNFKELLRLQYGDVIFNYQTQQIGRSWGNVKGGKGQKALINKFNQFFGTNIWTKATNRDELRTIYKNQLKTFREFVEEIKIGKKGLEYHLLVAFRKTRGGSPWRSAIINSKELLECLGGEAVKFSLDYLSGKITTLNDYIPEDKKNEENKKHRNQKSLDDYL